MFLPVFQNSQQNKSRDAACRVSGDGTSRLSRRTRCVLFVAESFDRIETGGANGRNHPADQSDRTEDNNGDDQGDGVDREADVAGLGVFGHGAVKRQSADGEGDGIGENDSEEPADEGNGERLSQKLEEDVAAARAERLLDANLAGALGDRNQHDVHQADAANSQSKSADEAEKD